MESRACRGGDEMNCAWSNPKQCRRVACRSSWWTTFSTAWCPHSSVAPWTCPRREPPPATHCEKGRRV